MENETWDCNWGSKGLPLIQFVSYFTRVYKQGGTRGEKMCKVADVSFWSVGKWWSTVAICDAIYQIY